MLRNNANEQVHVCGVVPNNDDGPSAFNTVNIDSSPQPTVDTVLENRSDEGQDDDDPEDDVRVNLSTKLSNTSFDENLSHSCDLVIDTDTEDQGKQDFPNLVGSLGNGSSTLLDGTQNMSFGEHAVEELKMDDDAQAGDDWFDPEVITRMTTHFRDPRSPTSVRFNEAVTEYPLEDTTANLGSNASSMPGDSGGLRTANSNQGTSTLSSSGMDPMSGNSNTSSSNGNGGPQGSARGRDNPQGPDPNMDPLDLIVFVCQVTGGPISQWGLEGRIRASDMVQMGRATLTGRPVHARQLLFRADLVDRVAGQTYYLFSHNRRARI